MNKSWNLAVQESDDGEYFIELSDEILTVSGFAIGDALDWIDNHDGSFTLKKKESAETALVLVDTIQTYRVRYVVEAPANHPEYALDTVTMEEAKEFSQESLGETIVSHRVISRDEMLALCDVDNDYTKEWSDEMKTKTFVSKINADATSTIHESSDSNEY